MRKTSSHGVDESTPLQHYQTEMDHVGEDSEVIVHEKNHRKPVLFGGIIAFVLAIIFSMFSGGVSSEEKKQEVVANRITSEVTAGDQLFKEEVNSDIVSKDFSVGVNDSGGTARMLIWDFNKEDLDEVQISVNGEAVKEKLILTKEAAAISIAVPSTVTIKGLKDHGGGISYAVKFPNNKQTYFNVVTNGASNSYTVTVQP
ncbi:hypothetical protein QFZ87_000917 [Bacillus sp. SLBN-46]|uniref:hypothetical protein n=1 Tax=Bacillus sp. SLBN-46 TaxID=3042283 RepID=UPI00285EB796|nr:hypothetical protein [Bacillus sp. SLBN-46]MDR6121320.1 hypothetical protein [Bacillus sp. SLBN-46]